jgi:hypothetical protein
MSMRAEGDGLLLRIAGVAQRILARMIPELDDDTPFDSPVRLSDAAMAQLGLVRDGRGGCMPRTSEPVPPGRGGGKVYHYGDTYDDRELTDRNTIHSSEHLDVVMRDGVVEEVWFRCLSVPFTVHESGPNASDLVYGQDVKIRIAAIDWRDAS